MNINVKKCLTKLKILITNWGRFSFFGVNNTIWIIMPKMGRRPRRVKVWAKRPCRVRPGRSGSLIVLLTHHNFFGVIIYIFVMTIKILFSTNIHIFWWS